MKANYFHVWLFSLSSISCIFESNTSIKPKRPVPDEIYALSHIELNWETVDSATNEDSIRIRSRLITYHQMAADQARRLNARFSLYGDSVVMETVLKWPIGTDSSGGRVDTLYRSEALTNSGWIYRVKDKTIVSIQSNDCLNTQKNSTSLCFEKKNQVIFSKSCVVLEYAPKIEDALFGTAAYFHSNSCSEIPKIREDSRFEIRYYFRQWPIK